jgi:hypothetical protein
VNRDWDAHFIVIFKGVYEMALVNSVLFFALLLLATFSLERKRTPEEVERIFFAFSFVLIQKKQKIKDNPIAPRVCPSLRAAKAEG